jgi:predicted lipid carrier protein YhbT
MIKTLTTPPLFAQRIAHQFAYDMAKNLPRIIKYLPPPPFFLQKKIGEQLLQQLMAESIAMGEFEFLQDRWLQLSINDMGLSYFLTFADNKLLLSNKMKQADVHFSGNAREFILLASRTDDPDTLFFQRRLVIEGDTELGLYIKNTIDGLDFDQWPHWLNLTIQKIAIIVEEIKINEKK